MNILVDGQTLETPEINRGIGIYFKNVLTNMIKCSYEHNWYITVSKESSLSVLDSFVAKQLVPVVNDVFAPGYDYERTGHLNKALKSAIDEYDIDVLYIPNPLMENVLFPGIALRCKVFATLYDLIPFVMPIKDGPEKIKREYCRRLDFIKENKIYLLSISNFSKDDFQKNIGTSNNIYVTELAADERIFYKPVSEYPDYKEPYMLFTGGFNYRKNLNGAVKAFAKALELFPDDESLKRLKFYIVCTRTKESEQELNELIKKVGLERKIVLTGFLSDADLARLYQNTVLFFFPSLYEGFGLPILEAMLAGSYVLSADNSSLPEVCSGYALLCDGQDITDMAKKIKEAVHNSANEPLLEKVKRQEYARTFSWEKTAAKTITAFEIEVYGKNPEIIRKRLAIITPWPKQKTGIANYVYKLVPYLSNYFYIDIFVDNLMVKCDFLPNEYGSLYMIDEIDARHDNYDILLYQIGNNPYFHTGVYKYLTKYSGISEIHDFVINGFFSFMVFHEKQSNLLKEALISGYGKNKETLDYFKKVMQEQIYFNDEKYPMCHSVSKISKATIFHNKWSSKRVKKSYTIPHPCFDNTEVQNEIVEKLQERIGICSDNTTIIGVFSFLSNNRRLDSVVEVVNKLGDMGYKIKLVFWGTLDNIELLGEHKNLIDWCATGYLKGEEYDAGFILSDIVVNLRYPSMGESSGTLCEAMKYQKPIIVSDINQYTEYPDEVCWKVKPDHTEVNLLVDYISYLIDHREVRLALAENAGKYADKILSPARIAKQYYYVLNKGLG